MEEEIAAINTRLDEQSWLLVRMMHVLVEFYAIVIYVESINKDDNLKERLSKSTKQLTEEFKPLLNDVFEHWKKYQDV